MLAPNDNENLSGKSPLLETESVIHNAELQDPDLIDDAASTANPESVDGFESEEEFQPLGSQKLRFIRCNRCCRMEQHYLLPARSPVFLLTVICTLGLVYLVGPFACICCGSRRLLRFNIINPEKTKPVSKRLLQNRANTNHGWKRDQKIYGIKKSLSKLFRKVTKPVRDLVFRRNVNF